MKAKGKFISFLLVVDTFFVAYAYGFHSRQVLVVDPKLPPLVLRKEVKQKEVPKALIEKTESAKNSKNIKGDGKASASAAKAGAAARAKKPVLKQSPAKDKASSKSTKPGGTKSGEKKPVKKATEPAAKGKDP